MKMVKFVTLDGSIFKFFVVTIDALNILFALIASSMMNSNHNHINTCNSVYPTL